MSHNTCLSERNRNHAAAEACSFLHSGAIVIVPDDNIFLSGEHGKILLRSEIQLTFVEAALVRFFPFENCM